MADRLCVMRLLIVVIQAFAYIIGGWEVTDRDTCELKETLLRYAVSGTAPVDLACMNGITADRPILKWLGVSACTLYSVYWRSLPHSQRPWQLPLVFFVSHSNQQVLRSH